MRKVKEIILHHTVTSQLHTTPDDIRQIHQQRNLGTGIQYHYMILGNGDTKNTRMLILPGNHCWGHNEFSVGVAVTGNFEKDKINNEQLYSLIRLLIKLCKDFKLSAKDIKGHCEVAMKGHQTLCPGKNLKAKLLMIRMEVDRGLKNTWIKQATQNLKDLTKKLF